MKKNLKLGTLLARHQKSSNKYPSKKIYTKITEFGPNNSKKYIYHQF